MFLRPDIQPNLKNSQKLILTVATGNDAVSGLGVDSRVTTVNTDFLVNIAAQILELRDAETGEKLWTNPVPGSATYMRPIGHTRTKDSKEAMMSWVVEHEKAIKNLTDHNVVINGLAVSTQFRVFPALLDGKMRNSVYMAALEESVSQGYTFKKSGHGDRDKLDYNTCWVCLEQPNKYNKTESLHFQPKATWFPAIIRYGNSPMHTKMRTMEGFCKAGRARKVGMEQKRLRFKYTKEYKKVRNKALKEEAQEDFIKNCDGLRIDFPDKKVCF